MNRTGWCLLRRPHYKEKEEEIVISTADDYGLTLLRSLPEGLRGTWLEKVKFNALDDIPKCTKYRYPTNALAFRRPPGTKDMAVFRAGNCQLDVLLSLLSLHSCMDLELHPERYDKVKQDLAAGWCYMPWICYSQEDRMVELIDGRHRIIALWREFDLVSIPVVYQIQEEESICALIGVDG